MPVSQMRRLERLVQELAEQGLDLDGSESWHECAVIEIDYALRPTVHERRVPSYGAIIEPTTAPDHWEHETQLTIARRKVGLTALDESRRYADGIVSWLIRNGDDDEWAVFDRPAGSERDLVVIADALGAVVVQRHPAGLVRVAGNFGVYRWNGIDWHHQPRVSTWIDSVSACRLHGVREVFETLLEFAVHDLGARGIGATLVYRPDELSPASFDDRHPTPPPLRITHPPDLAPLRHALAQIDGAALFDEEGLLRAMGVRLVPSADAEANIDGFRGTRHTSSRRYSYDDPAATVIVVSEDGPVTVLRAGKVMGASPIS